ncbi:lasso peptide biosynthesis B2 protein [Sphingobium sp. H39-3-25]|uniref:lasso peptide biosynthesis B2 protein n=1 Tax=Sphingobium arseniciresistens TaxID=3030834 RepID=UPI0023B896C8|nr:lasso peptide biosynthesis B2 protein [Sphingobium arseniciresistens]
MQQRYRIADGIGFCRFEGRTIVLDITADRYWQLGEDAGRVLETVGAGMTVGIDEHALARLVTLGFVAPAGERPAAMTESLGASIGASLSHPSKSALERGSQQARAGWTMACEVTTLAIAARVALRRLALKTIMERLTARRLRATPIHSANNLEQLAQRFARCRRLLPLRPLCLPDSIAFLWFAMRRGHAPRLVFGVEAFPFTAHCWVQDGDVVLTDALDHVGRFKPIMVL